jgi:hypothetical protein
MEADLTNLNQEVIQLKAKMELLTAQQRSSCPPSSPWFPLKEAAKRLNFSSARSLKAHIKTGRVSPDCYRENPTPNGKQVRYRIHVDRFIKQLG